MFSVFCVYMIITYIFTSLLCFFTFSNSVFQFRSYCSHITMWPATIQIHKSFFIFIYLCHNVLPHNIRDAACGHHGGLHTPRCPRIAKRLRYCRIMRMIHRNAEAWKPRQGEIEPWMTSFDGFVLLWKPIMHNSYSILAAQRSGHRSVCSPPRCPRESSRTIISIK